MHENKNDEGKEKLQRRKAKLLEKIKFVDIKDVESRKELRSS